MPIKSSGELSMRGDIAPEFGSSTTNLSLRYFSGQAGFGTPDAMSEFYGYVRAAFIRVSGPTASGTGINSANPYQVVLQSRGDGNSSDQYGDHIGRAQFNSTRNVTFRLNTDAEQTTAYVYGSASQSGPWTQLSRASTGALQRTFSWAPFTYPYFKLTMDIQRGRENTIYSRTLSLWLS